MNKYEIEVKETTITNYVVEANSEKEADELFSEWAVKHQEIIAGDLYNNSSGWEFSSASPANSERFVDITYSELKEVAL